MDHPSIFFIYFFVVIEYCSGGDNDGAVNTPPPYPRVSHHAIVMVAVDCQYGEVVLLSTSKAIQMAN